MKIAIPLANGKLAMHFGHCEQFALIDVDDNSKKIVAENAATPPPHEPGLLPRWLAERNVTTVIAGGMGQRAQNLFVEHGITVIVGAPAEAPSAIVNSWLAGSLQLGGNACGH